jgi:hypothetical protein
VQDGALVGHVTQRHVSATIPLTAAAAGCHSEVKTTSTLIDLFVASVIKVGNLGPEVCPTVVSQSFYRPNLQQSDFWPCQFCFTFFVI